MAFHDVRLPDVIEAGATGGPTYRVDIVTTTGGREHRVSHWAQPRHKWNVASGIKDEAGFAELLAFWHARQGPLHSFRFKDWSDYAAEGELLGTGDGVETEFQLVKHYASGATTFTRTIEKPVAGSVTVTVDGNPMTAGWSVDTSTGVITFDDPPGTGAVVRASFEFDVPVRFADEEFRLTLEAVDIGQAQELNVIEVKGE